MGRIAESGPLNGSGRVSGPNDALDRNRAAEAHADNAARTLYERYSNRIFRYCLQRLRSVEEAEDAAQTTFLYAFVGLRRGVEPEFEVAWLYKIAENVCRTRRRSRFRRGRYETAADLLGLLEPAAAEPVRDERMDALPEILAGMPASQRRALLLREVQGLSYREIAEQLQTSVSAVETLLFRARRSCVRELERLAPPAERAFSLGTLAVSLKSLVSRSLVASGGAKTAAALVGAAAVAGGVIAAAPTVVAGSTSPPARARTSGRPTQLVCRRSSQRRPGRIRAARTTPSPAGSAPRRAPTCRPARRGRPVPQGTHRRRPEAIQWRRPHRRDRAPSRRRRPRLRRPRPKVRSPR